MLSNSARSGAICSSVASASAAWGESICQVKNMLGTRNARARTIASMQALTPPHLVEMIDSNYTKAAEWVEGLPEDQLQANKSFAQMTLPASDILANIGVLHGNHHLYEAAMRVAF
jgi:hypothetical protein